jgi:hypothetical protein
MTKIEKIDREMRKHVIIPKDNIYPDGKAMLDSIVTSMQFWVDEDENTKVAFTAMREISNLLMSTTKRFKNILIIVNLQESRRKNFVDTNLVWLPNTKDPSTYSQKTKAQILFAIKKRLGIANE